MLVKIYNYYYARHFAIAELPIPTRYADEKSNLNVVTYGLRVLRQVVCRFCKQIGRASCRERV